MSHADGAHVSRLCLETWVAYAVPAAEAARKLLAEARRTLDEHRGLGAATDETGGALIGRRLEEFDLALARMDRWTERWTEEAPSAPVPDVQSGIRAFESWHGAYIAAIAAVILCDACGQLRLDGSRLVRLYARWKQAHKALREALASSDADATFAGRLVDELPFRRPLKESGEPCPKHYLASMDARLPAPATGAEGMDEMPCFLNGARTRFIREALRGLQENLPEQSRAGPVREALERLRAADRLSPTQLEMLEDFVAELAGDMPSGRSWELRQRLKSIERDLASRP